MIARDDIVAASLDLEPNRSAVQRDVHRAASRGIKYLLVNENMVSHAMEEVRDAKLDLLVSGIVGFPIGQWIWPAKKVALDELATIQNGPLAVMHGVGPWLDCTEGAKEELAGISAIQREIWVMTSLSAIPGERIDQLADNFAHSGVRLLMLSNGVAASGLPNPSPDKITALARHSGKRFQLAAMAASGTPHSEIEAWLQAGADKVICSDFWALSKASSVVGKER